MSIPPPDSSWEESESWERDSKAETESRKFGSLGAIEQRSSRIAKAQEDVDIAVQAALAWLVPASIFFAFLIFWIGISVYAYHLLAPKGWLSAEQLKDLKTVLFSGAIGAVVSQASKRYIGKD